MYCFRALIWKLYRTVFIVCRYKKYTVYNVCMICIICILCSTHHTVCTVCNTLKPNFVRCFCISISYTTVTLSTVCTYICFISSAASRLQIMIVLGRVLRTFHVSNIDAIQTFILYVNVHCIIHTVMIQCHSDIFASVDIRNSCSNDQVCRMHYYA